MEAYFGVYSCSHCEYTWKSINSFVNEGQTCYKCKFVVMATEQRPLKKARFAHLKEAQERKLKGEGPFFGEFTCKRCRKTWCSAWTWFDTDEKTKLPQRCKRCKRNAYAETMRPLEKAETEITKPHQGALCGKCKKLGFSCEQLKVKRLGDRFAKFKI